MRVSLLDAQFKLALFVPAPMVQVDGLRYRVAIIISGPSRQLSSQVLPLPGMGSAPVVALARSAG